MSKPEQGVWHKIDKLTWDDSDKAAEDYVYQFYHDTDDRRLASSRISLEDWQKKRFTHFRYFAFDAIKPKLKKCPACASSQVDYKNDHVICRNCGMQGPNNYGGKDANILLWNSIILEGSNDAQ